MKSTRNTQSLTSPFDTSLRPPLPIPPVVPTPDILEKDVDLEEGLKIQKTKYFNGVNSLRSKISQPPPRQTKSVSRKSHYVDTPLTSRPQVNVFPRSQRTLHTNSKSASSSSFISTSSPLVSVRRSHAFQPSSIRRPPYNLHSLPHKIPSTFEDFEEEISDSEDLLSPPTLTSSSATSHYPPIVSKLTLSNDFFMEQNRSLSRDLSHCKQSNQALRKIVTQQNQQISQLKDQNIRLSLKVQSLQNFIDVSIPLAEMTDEELDDDDVSFLLEKNSSSSFIPSNSSMNNGLAPPALSNSPSSLFSSPSSLYPSHHQNRLPPEVIPSIPSPSGSDLNSM